MFLARFIAVIALTCIAIPVHANASTENFLSACIRCTVTNSHIEFRRYSREIIYPVGCRLQIPKAGAAHRQVWSRSPNECFVTVQRAAPGRTPGGHSAPGGGPARAPSYPSPGNDLMAPSLDSTLPEISPVPLPDAEAPAIAVPAPPVSGRPGDQSQTPPNCEHQETRDANGCLVSRRYVCDGVVTSEERLTGCAN